MEEIPDDVFAPFVSEMDGVQPGPRLQQHLGMGCGGVNTTLDGKKILYMVNSMSSLFYRALFIIYGATLFFYIYIYTYVYIFFISRLFLVVNN